MDHGRIHGLIEGRALGREKGFEMWEELGFYEGFAKVWQRICTNRASETDTRSLRHISHLLDLISEFPRVNPSLGSDVEQDIPKLFRQIRSRYKALCSTLGVRPSLRMADGSPRELDEEDDATSIPQSNTQASKNHAKGSIWRLDPPEPQLSGAAIRQDLTF